jgi:hypothetical protein
MIDQIVQRTRAAEQKQRRIRSSSSSSSSSSGSSSSSNARGWRSNTRRWRPFLPFLGQARGKLAQESYKQLIDSITRRNNQQQTNEDTLAEARQLFGPENTELYHSFQKLMQNLMFKGANTGSASDVFQIKLIPDEYVGHVIGKQRTSLQEILRESGAKIEIQTNEGIEPGKTAFKLTGNTEAVEKASQIIDRIVQKIKDYEQGKGKGKDRKDTDVAGKGKGKDKDRLNHGPTATLKPTWKPKAVQ